MLIILMFQQNLLFIVSLLQYCFVSIFRGDDILIIHYLNVIAVSNAYYPIVGVV